MINFEKVKSSDTIIYSTTVNGVPVEFEVEIIQGSYWSLGFTVADDYQKTELPKRTKLAITRWLMSVWKDVQLEHDCFSCQPSLDGEEYSNSDIRCGFVPSWRAQLYTKLGFVPISLNGEVDYCYMTYGREPNEEELTSYFG